jgi:hypothetical protein
MPRQKQQASTYHNSNYVVSAKTKNPDAVKKVTAFLSSKRHAEIITNTFPPWYNGMTEIHFQKYNWVDTKYITEAMQYGFQFPFPSGSKAGPVRTMMEQEMNKIFTKPQLGNSLAEMQTLLNAELAK